MKKIHIFYNERVLIEGIIDAVKQAFSKADSDQAYSDLEQLLPKVLDQASKQLPLINMEGLSQEEKEQFLKDMLKTTSGLMMMYFYSSGLNSHVTVHVKNENGDEFVHSFTKIPSQS